MNRRPFARDYYQNKIYESSKIIFVENKTEYYGIAVEIFPKSNTVTFEEENKSFKKRVDANNCYIR